MYEAHYGLNSRPFELNPDPNFYFGSKQHSRARAYLEYGVSKHEGFIVITGEIGAVKTTILRGLIEGLHGSNVITGHVVTTQLDAEDTLRMVGAAFGIAVTNVPKSNLLMTLEAFLVSQAAQGKRCLLIVDEAQNLSSRAVEELRMLSNFQFGNQSLLQSFLVGQPEFRQILQRPEMEQFRQRVAATCHIGALEEAETQAYIEHRLKCAGSTGLPTFDTEAFLLIHKTSGGIPRRINALCDRLLLLGFLSARTHMTVADVTEVAREFAQESQVSSELSRGAHSYDVARPDYAAGEVPNLAEAFLPHTVADDLSHQIGSFSRDQRHDQLQRLERSVLRLEHISIQTLSTLQKLVDAIKRPSEDSRHD